MRRVQGGRGQTGVVIGVVLALVALYGVMTVRRGTDSQAAQARFDDATPLGGKGLQLLMSRLGYVPKRAQLRLGAMPPDARVWLLLDGNTRFSKAEARLLLAWVRGGGTLIFAVSPPRDMMRDMMDDLFEDENTEQGVDALCEGVGVVRSYGGASAIDPDTLLPQLAPLVPGAASVYWDGVKGAVGGGGQLAFADTSAFNRAGGSTEHGFLEIAGDPVGPVIVRRTLGQGRVILIPNALMFTNYALARPDNAVFASNLIRYGTPPGAAIYWDERHHGEPGAHSETPDNMLRYLRAPALRSALLQLLVAALLLWTLFGTRLGAAVPLPEGEPVTRASNFARALGALFHKAGRAEASGAILGAEFRRTVTRRVGLAPGDSLELVASRVAEAANVPQPLVLRLLRRADIAPTVRVGGILEAAPRAIERLTTGDPEARSEDELLRDAQEMEDVLRKLGVRR